MIRRKLATRTRKTDNLLGPSALCLAMTIVVMICFTHASIGQRTSTDQVTVAMLTPISNVNSLTDKSYNASSELLRPLIFNSLTRNAADLSIEGELAREIITSKDGRSISFILRENVRFHNGRDFTASDVKYTLEQLFVTSAYRAFAFYESVGKKGSAQNIRLITGITIDNLHKITLNIIRPTVRDQILASLAYVPIVPTGSIQDGQDLQVGTGPFRVVRLDRDTSEILLESNPEYWNGKPPITLLRLKTFPDFEQVSAGFRTSDIDVFEPYGLLTSTEREQLAGINEIKIDSFDGNNIQYLGLNVNAAPLNDLKIRRAIAYAIDRETLIRDHLGGNALPAYSILPESSWAYSAGVKHELNIDSARNLVKSSKLRNRTIIIQASSGNDQVRPALASIRDSLRTIGLKAEVELVDPSTLRNNLMTGEFQMTFGTWTGGNQDPLFLRDLFHSSKIPGNNVACCNRNRYSNRRVDRLLDSAGDQTNRDAAATKYKEAWQVISSDLPLIPLWYPAQEIVHNRRIQINSKPNGSLDFLSTVTPTN